MRRRRGAWVVAAVVVAGALAGAPGAGARGVGALPLGPAGLAQTVTVRQLTAGVTLTTITRGKASPDDRWTVRAGFEPTRDSAEALAQRLAAKGFPGARLTRIDQRPAGDPRAGTPLGFLVTVGSSTTRAPATALGNRLTTAGFTGTAPLYTALTRPDATGPWVVHELRIDPRIFRGTVGTALSNGRVTGEETVRAMASRLGALAGVNGGYFVIAPGTGTLGSAAGVQVTGGDITAESDLSRAALFLPPAHAAEARIARPDTRQSVTSSDGSTTPLTGIDRALGHPRDCAAPNAGGPCAAPDDLVAFDSAYGTPPDTGPGTEAVLDSRHRVVQLRIPRGGTLARGQTAVEGIGAGARWLQAHARPGGTLRVRKALTTGPVTPRLGVVNGGPLLVRNGEPDVDAQAEGFNPPSRPAAYFGFGCTRNPRTMVGLTRDHQLLLVTVDGRAPGHSIGLDFAEEAALMAALGAQTAMNLDGGGSTDMVAAGAVQGRPSDGAERPVGDAVLLFPPRYG